MPRILSDDEEYPPGWLRDSWNRDEELERRLERDRYCPAESLGARHDVERTGDGGTREGPATPRERHSSPERPVTHCPTCGRALEARLTCIACGDEEQEAA